MIMLLALIIDCVYQIVAPTFNFFGIIKPIFRYSWNNIKVHNSIKPIISHFLLPAEIAMTYLKAWAKRFIRYDSRVQSFYTVYKTVELIRFQ